MFTAIVRHMPKQNNPLTRQELGRIIKQHGDVARFAALAFLPSRAPSGTGLQERERCTRF